MLQEDGRIIMEIATRGGRRAVEEWRVRFST
jgi:hypothetical protein